MKSVRPTFPIPIVPPSAPFSAEQRAWLNGFFAGLLSWSADTAEKSPLTVAPAPQEEEDDESAPWHDPSLSLEERMTIAEGQPLPRRLMAAMAQLDCGACGYVCSTYSKALASGKESRLELCAPGGTETARKLRELMRGAGPSDPSAAKAPTKDAPGTRACPATAHVLGVDPLTAPTSSKATVLVRLGLAEDGPRYLPGDALGILPENDPAEVEELLDALALDAGSSVLVDGARRPLRDALRTTFDVRAASESHCAAAGVDPDSAPWLIDLARRGLRLEPQALVDGLGRIRPRLYSIASSLRAHPAEVHLTVGVVRYERDGSPRTGLASCFLAERCAPGQSVAVFVQPSPRFRLPADGETPIVMIGPGTGIAPFRSFLQERRELGCSGDAWLFFGERTEAADFLFRADLEQFSTAGVLTRLSTAFSRDGREKVYVQHRMLEAAEEFWSWLERGAHVYVCGDASRMARDVESALLAIAAGAGGLNDGAADWLAELRRSGRYQRDVY